MALHAALHHLTHYAYNRPITLGPQVIRLRPAPHTRTPIESYSLRIEPRPHFLNWLQDPHGNYLARVVFPNKVTEFRVQVDLIAEMTVINPFDFFIEDYAETFPFTYQPQLREELTPFLSAPVDTGKRFTDYLAGVDKSPRHTTQFLVELNQKLENDIVYLVRMEPGVQTPEETLERGKGSCRDTAWLLINLLRALGFAARFASGYLIQLKPDVKSLDGPSGTEEDFTDLHAWAEVFIPGAGWIGLDPTSGLLAGEGHIPLACAPSPLSAAPISGELESCGVEFEFDMKVERVRETPRVTKPYTEEAWQAIRSSGHDVDTRLKKAGITLTMGGEPTFISMDDPDGAEWNTAAVGADKLRLSQQLMKRLASAYGKDALLHFGQGKWYPGESLPRWAYSCYWRKDGVAVWKNPKLLADIETDYGYTSKHAEQFISLLAETLDVETDNVTPAFEDIWYFLWKERKLPANVDPLDSHLKDPEERERLARIYERGLDEPRGFVLPIQRMWQARARKWRSGKWFLRQKHVFLIPGDSSIGLRLPLESLPWASSTAAFWQQDPSAPLPPLPTQEEATRFYARQQQQLESEPAPAANEAAGEFGPRKQELPTEGDAAHDDVRTAMTVEVRDGKIFVFMPPMSLSEDYLEMVSALEDTAERMQVSIIIEGERPPADPRLESFKITPDPGVIEVNMHPSASWEELVSRTETLYEEARQTRLTSEKFMIDGKHVGTGGGNHIILGGPTPSQSPLLQRPDVLRSMIAYWLHHPSLSYFFSGLFIGPTSQSPRMDEARNDAIYELEIAFRELDRQPGIAPPWLVDRVFRNLLIDMTGNTHRAEFCIDKLYNPDSPSGRLGLLELRSYEMPPHARMSLAQHLLLRALLVHFWEKPYYPARLKRWGTELHDRFMLPHFVWQDFCDVLEDLRLNHFTFDENWFTSHFAFRFPKYGEVCYRDIQMEIRGALEPWHVLGEEGYAGGTVRYVDSSLERLQVKVNQCDMERFGVLCNGRRVPLTPSGRHGEHIAGVRFRAWQPASCLHPTIGVDAPLTFELVDIQNGQTLGGCTYHVAHPAGRNYETLPVNAYEAEARRRARFEPIGHTPGGRPEIPPLRRSHDFPLTLDLRLDR